MALTLEQESALLALLNEKRTTVPELSAATDIQAEDLFLVNQTLADKSVTAEVMKKFISPEASLTQQGIVQLSNDIGNNSESMAVTPKVITELVTTQLYGRLLNIQVFNQSGQYKPTLGTKRIKVMVTAGGGGGGGTLPTAAGQYAVGAGGGAGGTAISLLDIDQLTLPVKITIGKGGIGGVIDGKNTPAMSGESSYFGDYLFATAGSFAANGFATQANPTLISNGGGGDGHQGNILNCLGGSGGRGLIMNMGHESGEGGTSYHSAGGFPLAAAVAMHGCAGRYGAGGGGAFAVPNSLPMVGGKGGDGIVIIEEYA